MSPQTVHRASSGKSAKPDSSVSLHLPMYSEKRMIETKSKINSPSTNTTPLLTRLSLIHTINEPNELKNFVLSPLSNTEHMSF